MSDPRKPASDATASGERHGRDLQKVNEKLRELDGVAAHRARAALRRGAHARRAPPAAAHPPAPHAGRRPRSRWTSRRSGSPPSSRSRARRWRTRTRSASACARASPRSRRRTSGSCDEYVAIQEKSTELAQLYVALERIHGGLSRGETLAALQEIVINVVGSEELAIFERRGDRLVLVQSFGIDPEPWRELPADRGALGRAAAGELYVAGRDGEAGRRGGGPHRLHPAPRRRRRRGGASRSSGCSATSRCWASRTRRSSSSSPRTPASRSTCARCASACRAEARDPVSRVPAGLPVRRARPRRRRPRAGVPARGPAPRRGGPDRDHHGARVVRRRLPVRPDREGRRDEPLPAAAARGPRPHGAVRHGGGPAAHRGGAPRRRVARRARREGVRGRERDRDDHARSPARRGERARSRCGCSRRRGSRCWTRTWAGTAGRKLVFFADEGTAWVRQL